MRALPGFQMLLMAIRLYDTVHVRLRAIGKKRSPHSFILHGNVCWRRYTNISVTLGRWQNKCVSSFSIKTRRLPWFAYLFPPPHLRRAFQSGVMQLNNHTHLHRIQALCVSWCIFRDAYPFRFGLRRSSMPLSRVSKSRFAFTEIIIMRNLSMAEH